MRIGGIQVFEHICELIYTHLTVALGISSSNVNSTRQHLFLASNQNVIPLGELCVSDLLVDLA